MKTPTMLMLLLGLFAFVCCSPFLGHGALEPRPGSAPSSDDTTVLKRCSQLGLNTFVKLLNELNLTQLLESYPLGEYFTVFAPTDEAFQKIPQAQLKNKTWLEEIVKFHIVQANTEYFIGDMSDAPRNNFRATLPSLQGAGLAIVYYQIKTKGKPDQKLYLVTESPVSKLDQAATNGVVQVLDAVKYPPQKTLQGILKESQFSMFFGMIEQTDVIAYLISNPVVPLTVLAPTNEAFQKLPKDVMQKIKTNLTYNGMVIESNILGNYYYTVGMQSNEKIPTLLPNRSVTVTFKGDKIMLDGAEIIKANYTTFGGIVHTMNQVLLPTTDNQQPG